MTTRIVRLAGPAAAAPTPARDQVGGVGDPHTLEARLVAWPSTAEVSDDGRTTYTEVWNPGGLIAGPGPLAAYAGHAHTGRGLERGPLIGRVDGFRAADDGAYADIVLANTVAAAEVWELARTVGATVSIEADVDAETPPGRRAIRSSSTPAVLTGVAVMLAPFRGAVPGAEVLAVRALPPDTLNGDTVTILDTPTEPDVPDVPDVPPAPPTDPDEIRVSRGELAEIVRGQLVRVRPAAAADAHPLAHYPTLAAYWDDAYAAGSVLEAVQHGGERPLAARIARAFVDQITTNNPGVIPPGWISEVFGLVDFGRPVIAGIGTRPLPAEGMDVNWPYFDGDLLALIGPQAVQKTDIVSVRVDLKKGSTPLTTYAGGSDVSLQLIRRSSPSYRDAYLRIMLASWAAVTERDAETDLYDGGTGFVALAGTATDVDFKACLFQASVDVRNATGSPASVVALASDLFVKFGSSLNPSVYGTNNVVGTANASSLDVSVSGLRVVEAPHLAAGTGLVTNGRAAAWGEDGPFTITALDVSKLGENIAVWGMAALMIFAPAGVVRLAATAPVVAGTESSGRSRKS